MMLKNNKKGFTLIEIIVVVVILAVLMAVAVPSVLKYIDTAQEAPALTETHAIVTAAQKKVIEKYSQTKNENISLSASDNQWIEDFVGEGGTIYGDVTVTNKEVTRLLYHASNGLYVLYENQEYKIIDEDNLSNTVVGQLNQMIVDYTKLTKELVGNKAYLNRNEPIKVLIEGDGLVKVDDNLTKEALGSSNESLYWRPYYLGSVNDPQLIMYANTNNTNATNWNSKIMYVNGKIYKTDHNIASYFNDYKTIEALEKAIQEHPEKYTLIN